MTPLAFAFIGLLTLALPARAQQTDSSLLSVQRIYGTREFRSQSFGPARWLGDGSSYTTLEGSEADKGQNLVRYDSERGGREVLVAARQFVPQGDSVRACRRLCLVPRTQDAADLPHTPPSGA